MGLVGEFGGDEILESEWRELETRRR